MTELSLDEKIKINASKAVDLAKRAGVNLDYSNASVVGVEKVLGLLHEQVAQTSVREEQFRERATVFGVYLGQTLIKNLGKGSWVMEPGQNALAVEVEGKFFYFQAKAYRRLKDGKAENVIAFYEKVYNNFSEEKISLGIFQNG